MVGTCLVTASVHDATWASAVAIQQISAKPASGGITILSPGDGSTVNWPTTLVASANTGAPVAAMRVLIDGQPAYATSGDALNTALKSRSGRDFFDSWDLHGDSRGDGSVWRDQ
jgi:hypothetical protein